MKRHNKKITKTLAKRIHTFIDERMMALREVRPTSSGIPGNVKNICAARGHCCAIVKIPNDVDTHMRDVLFNAAVDVYMQAMADVKEKLTPKKKAKKVHGK